MNTKKNVGTIFLVILSCTFLVPLATGSVASQNRFVSGLNGNQEVPRVNTNATGSASFILTDEATISYELNASGISNLTGVSLNLGRQGENGPVLIELIKPPAPIIESNGTISEGTISSAVLQGTMKEMMVGDLANLMQNGSLYVNIMTIQNPRGEIRGQIGFEGVDESGTMAGQGNVTREPNEVD